MEAKPIVKALRVIEEFVEGDELWIHVDCHDHDEYKNLPNGVEYRGRVLGKAGWSSDTYKCAYSTTWKLARGL